MHARYTDDTRTVPVTKIHDGRYDRIHDPYVIHGIHGLHDGRYDMIHDPYVIHGIHDRDMERAFYTICTIRKKIPSVRKFTLKFRSLSDSKFEAVINTTNNVVVSSSRRRFRPNTVALNKSSNVLATERLADIYQYLSSIVTGRPNAAYLDHYY